jgi:hypothetical protein
VEADRHADLAGSRTGQKLAQRDEVGVGGVADPFAPDDEGFPEIAEMGDRASEGGQAERQKGAEDLGGRARLARSRLFGFQLSTLS